MGFGHPDFVSTEQASGETPEKKKRPIAVRSWRPRKKQATVRNKSTTEQQEEVKPEVKPTPAPASVPEEKQHRQRVIDALEAFTRFKGENVNAWSACKKMREMGLWLDRDTHYVGHTPGVEVGDVFHYRGELLVVNLHREARGGIHTIRACINRWEVPVANSIVVSDGYYQNEVYSNCFVYTGSGSKTENQQLVRGNLSLKNSCENQVPVRVISVMNSDNVFRYEGLYKVKRVSKEENRRGYVEYKYLMEPCTSDTKTESFKEILRKPKKRV